MSSTKHQMFVRCKRQDQTFFIQCSRSDTFSRIKERVSNSLSGDTAPSDIKFFTNMTGDRELPDIASIADHEIENDDILFMVFRNGTGDDDWEDVQVTELASGE
mmetsp:Transcript_30674/g.45411  ORF Transcript_30674/g.45411 Transcript_30674/m.45411 type:complete len:104 (-) Transcript_30674:610-921(-)